MNLKNKGVKMKNNIKCIHDSDIINSVGDSPESNPIFVKGIKNMKTGIFCLTVLFFAVCLFSAIFAAEVPHLINYQGKLTKSGTCALDTTIAMTFQIYTDSTTSISLWTETQSSVKVEDGNFNVLLGSVVSIPDSAFNGSIRYLGVKVGGDAEMTPCQPIVSVGYAYRSFQADTADYARGFSGVVENTDKVDGLHASSTPTAGYLYPLDGSAKIPNSSLYTGPGNGLDADYVDGQHASAFLNLTNDYGRSGVAADLYEGASTLTNKYVNEGQASSITSSMITDNQVMDIDISPSANIAATKINDGPGSGLDADLLDAQQGSYYTNASNINAGTLSDGRLSPNVDLVNGSQTFTGIKTFNPGSGSVPFTVDATKNGTVANLNADMLDGQEASAFLTTANDYGRSGVAADLYEGAVTLTNKYVNENQNNSITSSMIQDFQIQDIDISNAANIAPSKIQGTAWTSNNDGPGSGLDADMLDGKQANQFVDGSGNPNYIPKLMSTSTISNSIIYEMAGKIGIGTIGPNTTTDINGDLALRSGNYAAVVGNNNNIIIGARSFVMINGPAGAFTITGISGGVDGKMVILYNNTGFNLTIADNSPLSLPQNRILTMSGANQSTVGTGNVTLIYDATAMVWVITAMNP
jgi:hypothetical protein